ncbi:uncharacterized protein LOC123542475 [Mercenaria mercenaria]|uniref:uncharacterized protein LOC123542475 n=1 Tax=Mercenaria mercenaria TaxID=6596 RepID=UPI00234F8990|nr:uncharacterized protein LOC123542475 [Mercenaria mercenaria]
MARLRNSVGYLFLFICSVFATEISASSGQVCRKEKNTRGRHFLVTFPPFYSGGSDKECIIYIASEGHGNALITKHVDQTTTQIGNYNLSKGVVHVKIDCASIIQSSVGRKIKVIEVETTTDVAVYAAGYKLHSAATYVVFPSKTLANSYVIPTYKTVSSNWYNYILITSLNNDTTITVTNFNGNHSEKLNKLESYTQRTAQDPNVSSVTSNKAINILYGCMCTTVPSRLGIDCDGLYDSQVPVRYFGTTFIISPVIPKSGYAVRLYANTTSATVSVKYSNTTSQGSVSFTGMHELQFGTDATVITSDKPLNVIQYGYTAKRSDHVDYGDAFMASVPAVTHFSNNYVFPTPFPDKNFTYRIAVTIQNNHFNGLLLDGRNVSSMNNQGTWTPPSPFNNFTIVTLELSPGNHILNHLSQDARFSVLLYGLKQKYGFGLYLGFSFADKDSEYTCENGGYISGEGNCTCLNGFTGHNCEHNIDECSSNPCKNGARCVDGIASYKCVCNSGYTGSNCGTDIDDCYTSPCMNGATCVDGVSRYSCVCKHGYTGHNCQTDIDECSSNPCMNDGTCTDEISSYRCACRPGYTGQNCETSLQTKDLTCFSCDYTSAPSYCDNIEYCSGDKMCFIERLTHSQGYQYYKSGCKDRQICSQESQADAQSGKSCLQCCEGSFCNSQGCGDHGLPPIGTRGPLCLDCSFVSDPKLCHKVAFCSSDEKCHIEEVGWGSNFIYHLGCKSSHECAFEESNRMVSSNTITSRSLPACEMCCDADFCNRNCTKHDTDNQQAIIG